MRDTYDFSGWATKNDLRCSDGRTIRRDAFKHNDGCTVPLVWNHKHDDPYNVLGHALLENREEGVYAYCTFNETESGQNAKNLVTHGDVCALSIYANGLKQNGGDVLHGAIREVSLVLAGANPGALIDSVLSHGEESDEEAIIYTGETLSLFHAENAEKSSKKGKTVGDVFKEFTDEQKTVVYALIAQALESKKKSEEENEGDENMKHNAFDKEEVYTGASDVLTHSDMQAILGDAKRCGSLKEAVLAHGMDGVLMHDGESAASYGIEDIDYLFPDAHNLNTPPAFIKRPDDWVSGVMNGVHHSPFSRIKSMFADITEDEARAKGYIKGHLKKEEVFTLLKRTTTPTTIYKKQKLDRDDIIDITDFDVVAWIKGEMRMMLNEEIARAILIGDGRLTSDDDHISATNIRPIAFDDDLYTIKTSVTAGATDSATAKNFIRAAIKARKDYRGSGSPALYTTEDMLTEMLLIEDGVGRVIYDTVEKLKNALRVSKIVTVPVMEGLEDSAGNEVYGIIVNLNDYTVGADKGGSVSMFDDFDIDYNRQKYLIETRCSGALTKPYSAICLKAAAASVTD